MARRTKIVVRHFFNGGRVAEAQWQETRNRLIDPGEISRQLQNRFTFTLESRDECQISPVRDIAHIVPDEAQQGCDFMLWRVAAERPEMRWQAPSIYEHHAVGGCSFRNISPEIDIKYKVSMPAGTIEVYADGIERTRIAAYELPRVAHEHLNRELWEMAGIYQLSHLMHLFVCVNADEAGIWCQSKDRPNCATQTSPEHTYSGSRRKEAREGKVVRLTAYKYAIAIECRELSMHQYV